MDLLMDKFYCAVADRTDSTVFLTVPWYMEEVHVVPAEKQTVQITVIADKMPKPDALAGDVPDYPLNGRIIVRLVAELWCIPYKAHSPHERLI